MRKVSIWFTIEYTTWGQPCLLIFWCLMNTTLWENYYIIWWNNYSTTMQLPLLKLFKKRRRKEKVFCVYSLSLGWWNNRACPLTWLLLSLVKWPVGGAVALRSSGCSERGCRRQASSACGWERFIHSERAKTEGAVWHLIMPPAHAGWLASLWKTTVTSAKCRIPHNHLAVEHTVT